MKAVVYMKEGRTGRFLLREVDKPAPGADEVLVRVRAVSLNAGDYRSIQIGNIPKQRIFGADIAGVVEAIGTGVSRFQPGDEVVGDLFSFGFGGLAEYAAAPERAFAAKPAGVSFENAAALPTAGQTALQGLRLGGIKARQKVLICGAGGGVGTFAVQLARHFGAEVTAVCSQGNMELVRGLGASHVMDYRKQRFAQSPDRYDLILAVNGNNSLRAYMRALAPGGMCVMAGGAFRQIARFLIFGGIMSLGSKKLRFLAAHTKPEDIEFLVKLVESGVMTPAIDRQYPLSEAADAMRYISLGHARGKVVITV